MKHDSKYKWYVIDTLVFLFINFFFLYYFPLEITNSLTRLNWTIIVIFALGVYRLTDVITKENVTDFIRAPFMDKKGDGKWEMSEYGLRGFFGTLFSCNACMGVWVSIIIFYFFVFFPDPTMAFMVIMTLTSFERFLSKIYNFLEKRG